MPFFITRTWLKDIYESLTIFVFDYFVQLLIYRVNLPPTFSPWCLRYANSNCFSEGVNVQALNSIKTYGIAKRLIEETHVDTFIDVPMLQSFLHSRNTEFTHSL